MSKPSAPTPAREPRRRIPVLWQCLVILAVAAVPTVLSGRVALDSQVQNAGQDSIRRITIAEAMTLAPVLWIDARSRAAYTQEHLPGALPLTEDDWETGLVEVLMAWNPEDAIVVYCSTADCDTSIEVAQRLVEEAGLEPVTVLDGGWEAYEAWRP